MKVLEYLSKIGWPHRECSDGEIAIKCPWCGYEKLDKTVSINSETGWGTCQHDKRCGKHGFNFYELRKQTGDRDLANEKRMEQNSKPKEYKKASEANPETNRECSDLVAEFFRSRGLDPAKIAATKLVRSGIKSWKDGQEWRKSPAAVFLYSEDGTVVDRKFRLRDGNEKPWKNFQRETDCPSLFGMPLVNPEKGYLTITGGELDTLAALQIGGINPVNGPSETDHGWIDRHWDWLQGFHSFYIATDNDKVGNTAAEAIAMRLGKDKCYRVIIPDGCKDICDAVSTGAWTSFEQFDNALNMASDFTPKKLIHFSRIVDLIFDRKPEDDLGDMTHLPTLNRALRGFRPHEMTLWPGDDKSGKSTLLANIELGWLIRGIPCCTGSFELPLLQHGGWVRDMLFEFAPTSAECRELAKKLPKYMIDHIGNIKPDDLVEMYIFAAKRYGVRHFITDSLTLVGLDEGDWDGQARFVKMIKQELVTPFPVHHHLVNHTRKGKTDKDNRNKADSRGNAIVKAIHDNMIMTYRENNEDDNSSETILALKSNRQFGETVSIKLKFSQKTRMFSEAGAATHDQSSERMPF